tara:strand:+ start:99 stop:308 length:210 start_codon:yes stop_codon:yes gene_type:complete
MNERIKELAMGAGFINGHQDLHGNSLSQELEKFAESLIKECAKVAYLNRIGAMHWDIDVIIKNHFGIDL